eukprot:6212618-Pleurochrysis_carterae.AAC.2
MYVRLCGLALGAAMGSTAAAAASAAAATTAAGTAPALVSAVSLVPFVPCSARVGTCGACESDARTAVPSHFLVFARDCGPRDAVLLGGGAFRRPNATGAVDSACAAGSGFLVSANALLLSRRNPSSAACFALPDASSLAVPCLDACFAWPLKTFFVLTRSSPRRFDASPRLSRPCAPDPSPSLSHSTSLSLPSTLSLSLPPTLSLASPLPLLLLPRPNVLPRGRAAPRPPCCERPLRCAPADSPPFFSARTRTSALRRLSGRPGASAALRVWVSRPALGSLCRAVLPTPSSDRSLSLQSCLRRCEARCRAAEPLGAAPTFFPLALVLPHANRGSSLLPSEEGSAQSGLAGFFGPRSSARFTFF